MSYQQRAIVPISCTTSLNLYFSEMRKQRLRQLIAASMGGTVMLLMIVGLINALA